MAGLMRGASEVEVAVAVKVLSSYVLEVTFADGAVRTVDVEPLLHGPMFEALRAPKFFARAEIDEELGTVVWPNGADISPEFLYRGAPEPTSAG